MELIESSGIKWSALLSYPPPKLCEINNVVTNTAFFAYDPREEADNGKRSDDFVGEVGEGVGLLNVSSDGQNPIQVVCFGGLVSPRSAMDLAEKEKRRRDGF